MLKSQHFTYHWIVESQNNPATDPCAHFALPPELARKAAVLQERGDVAGKGAPALPVAGQPFLERPPPFRPTTTCTVKDRAGQLPRLRRHLPPVGACAYITRRCSSSRLSFANPKGSFRIGVSAKLRS